MMFDSETYKYGNSSAYELTRLALSKQGVSIDSIVLPRSEIEYFRFRKNLYDLDGKLEVIYDPKTNLQFEIGVVNSKNATEEAVDAEISSSTTSLNDNASNTVEFAENAASHPKRRRLYISTPGNGKSSHWNSKERYYIKRTGSYINEDGSTLPTIAALNRSLMAAGYPIRRLSSVSNGGSLIIALMREFNEGQVTHACIKARPNLNKQLPSVLWSVGLLIRDMYDDRRTDKASTDNWKLCDRLIKMSVAEYPRLNKKLVGNNPRTKLLAKLITGKTPSWSDTSKPSPSGTTSALLKQPEVMLTYQLPVYYRNYNNPLASVSGFLLELKCLSEVTANGQIEALVMPGAYHDHKSYPALKWSLEKYAFARQLGR
jgi:hypothetical protein